MKSIKTKKHTFKSIFSVMTVFMLLIVGNIFFVRSYAQAREISDSQKNLLTELENLNDEFGVSYDGTMHIEKLPDDSVNRVDKRSAALKSYLRRLDSPLFAHTDVIIEQADFYHFDYRLVVAIALQESTGCKFIPENSYNCWGWGIYGDKITRFQSYEEGIRTVSKGLNKNYIERGYTTTEEIMSKYTPSSNGSWARGVTYFFGKLDHNK